MSRFYQKGAKRRAACFANASLAVLLSGLHDRRIEAGVARHSFGPREAVGLPQDRPRGGRADEPHARYRQQHPDGGDVGHTAGDFALDSLNLGFQRGDLTNVLRRITRSDAGSVARRSGVSQPRTSVLRESRWPARRSTTLA